MRHMKKLPLAQYCMLLAATVLLAGHLPTCASTELEMLHELEEPEEQQPDSSPKGSWSHWWSYDGISGPSYWNINKRWQICSRGRQQSPVELRTQLLVYDHLLGPFRLQWQVPDAVTGNELPVSGLQEEDSERAAEGKRAKKKKVEEGGAEVQPPNDAAADKPSQSLGPHAYNNSNSIRLQLLNTGRGLELSPLEDHSALVFLSEGPLSYSYRLFRLELHSSEQLPEASTSRSGSNSGTTSEHLIDGRWFDGELQLHFYNHQLASSWAQAAKLAERGSAPANLFAAIAVFIIAASSNSAQQQPASPLDSILKQVSKVPNKGDRIELLMERSQLESLVPNRHQYITYQGSQNRPPCAEGLHWILVNQALRVDAAKFRWALFEQTSTSQDNVRPIQPLNGRLLRTTIDWGAIPAAHSNCPMASNSTTNAGTKSDCPQQQQTTTKPTNLSQQQPPQNLTPSLGLQVPKSNRLSCSVRPTYQYQLSSLN